jgi:glycosyltransferase involved in cell wall biosynthesis
MEVVMVSGHACIRVHKMTIPLVQDGYKVHLISKKVPPIFLNYYYTYSMAEGMAQFVDIIDIYAKSADIFHCHNEPSWFVTAIKERCDVPVVLDIHDSYLGRLNQEEEESLITKEHGKKVFRYITEERNNFNLADGLIFPGQAFSELVTGEYNLQQPKLTLPSYVPRAYCQYHGVGHLGGLVYEGRVDLPNGDVPNQLYGFRYCDYVDLAKQCKSINMDLHLYCTREDEEFIKLYKDLAIIHPPHSYDALMLNLQAHDWGLVGNIMETSEWDIAYPNKMFEYISAGVPVVAINAPECAKFLKETGFGIEVSSIEELGQRWKEHMEIRKVIIKNRQKYTMENNIGKLKEFYGKFV